jgi:hypothetical protein
MRKRAAAGGLAVAGALAAAFWFQPPTQIIRNDNGGNVEARVHQIAVLRQAGTRVEIRGRCASACTMLIGLPKACVARTARLEFHGPSSQYYGVSLSPHQFEYWSGVMAGYYPPRMRAWFMSTARQTTMGVITISGAQAARLGARACR